MSIALVVLGASIYMFVTGRGLRCFFRHKWRKRFEVVNGEVVGARICLRKSCKLEQFKVGKLPWRHFTTDVIDKYNNVDNT